MKCQKLLVGIVFLLSTFGSLAGTAQTRISDQDVENMMKNLKDDASNFRFNFNSAVGKVTIRKTDEEKQAKSLVESFQKQTDMLKQFKDKKKADAHWRQSEEARTKSTHCLQRSS
jgi:hypothetical protein